MRTKFRLLRSSLVAACVSSALLLVTSNPFGQSRSQLTSPNGYVNDFAAVLDAPTKERLEAILENFKLRSKIAFYVATVETTDGKELFAYSLQLARAWKVTDRPNSQKSLLLVISVESKDCFTQISRSVQNDLPDGVLGELSHRMRNALSDNNFSLALDNGVQYFVSTMGQKMGFSLQDLEKPITTASAAINPLTATDTPQTTPVSDNQGAQTRPRSVNTTQTPSPEMTPASTVNTNQPQPQPATSESTLPVPSETPTTLTSPAVSSDSPRRNGRTTSGKANTTTRQARSIKTQAKTASESVTDEDESEQVELTFTKPLAQRPAILKDFLDTHPNSKARPRAHELLISTHAALGDQLLKNGDSAGGIEELMVAIDEADTSIPDSLFSGVIAQIPLNLYLRGEHAAAFKAAETIETKFGADPQRLLGIANFYLSIERGDEATRVATAAVKLLSDSAEAHRILAMGLHISLRLDEAAAEYKRALELDPNSKGAQASLADLTRGAGKPEEALALYSKQLLANPKDKAAITGSVISLLELGRKDEANSTLDAAISDDPANLQLLTGAAYWFAAHEKYDKALTLAQKAVAIEPRYTWAQIALARAELGLNHPLEAERAIRFARQYGRFPTLSYELATVLANMGLYEEAVEILRESFVLQDGQIETKVAGRVPTRNESFVELLAPERRASLYQSTPADTAANAKILKDLLAFTKAVNPAEGENVDEQLAVTAASEFAAGDDGMRAFRQVYSASRLLRRNVGLSTVVELADSAAKNADAALATPVATIAVQADEFRELRARALTAGNVPDVAEAPRNVLASIFRGRIEDLAGWALFNQDKNTEAVTRLTRGAEILPEGTPAWRSALWHLAVALEQTGNDEAALKNYIKSYAAGEPDSTRRGTIEKLYRKVNGSLTGLDERLGASTLSSSATATETSTPAIDTAATKPGDTPSTSSTAAAPAEEKPAAPEPAPSETKTEGTPTKQPEETAGDTKPTSDPTPSPTESKPTVTTNPSQQSDAQGMSESSLRAIASRGRTNVKITGRILDDSQAGIANVVVVLISPSGGVLAATTDSEGKYSFTVAPSEKSYRIIPSRDGYTFTPVDKSLRSLFDDQSNIDFVGTASRP